MNIFQTHKNMNYILQNKQLSQSVYSWAKFNTHSFNYHFYNDKQCEQFIKNIAPYINKDIYKAYCKLPLSVMKADLWRYCIIYHFGGIYADTDTICKINPQLFINDSLLTIVPENSCHLCQWVFAAPKGSPILKSVIDLSVERILSITEIKGEHIVHHLTGPGAFTDGIEKYLKEQNLPTCEHNKKLYYNYPHKGVLKVFNCDIFHSKIVQHLFYGKHINGWCTERDKHLL
jgi:alpha 1,6-mannosyltransferase